MPVTKLPTTQTEATELPDPPVAARSVADLVVAQLAGIDLVVSEARRHRHGPLSREEQMDVDRHDAACARESAAVRDWTARQLAGAVPCVHDLSRPRAVLAHRQPWFRDTVAAELAERGVDVVLVVQDGADASGAVLAEQPEIVLLESHLPSFSGLDVLRRVSVHAPGTFIGIQVEDPDEFGDVLGAGAGVAFTRRLAPAAVAVELARALV